MTELRVACPEDAAEIQRIYSYYVEKTAITFEYEVPSVEEMQRRIEHTLERFPYFAAIVDGQVKGYAYAGTFKARAAYDWSVETSIYVEKGMERHGIGAQLLKKLEEVLKSQNILNVNACIAVPCGEPDEYLTFDSVRFHEREGYKTVGTFHECGYKFSRWYNMVWMEKILGEHISPAPAVIPFPKLRR